MSSLGTMAGADVLRAVVDMPQRGPWSAEVRLATETIPSGSVTLAFNGGLSLVGTVDRAALDSRGSVVAYIVGGANGLTRTVSQHYRNGMARDILAAIARAAGETLASDIASDVNTVQFDRYTLAGDCTGALDSLARAIGASIGETVVWRIRSGGALWMGVESWPTYDLPKTAAILESMPGIGSYLLGVETPEIEPGSAVTDVGNVETVRHAIGADEVRSWLSVEMASLGGQFYRATRAALGLRAGDTRQLWRYGTFRAVVIAQSADLATVDVRFDGDVLPAAQAVPVRYHAGLKVQFGTGDGIEVGWDRGDPDRIFARPVSDGVTPIKIIIPATSKVYLGGDSGTDKLIRKTDYDGHTHGAGTYSGTITGTANPGGLAVTGTCTITLGTSSGAAAATGTTITEAK